MLTFALLPLAMALLCWPDARARRRLALPAERRFTPRPRAVLRLASGPLAALVGGLVAGPGGLCAATAIVMCGSWYWRCRRASRARLAVAASLAAGLRLLVAELRAGAHPAAAAEGAATDADHVVGQVFRRMAAAVRLGGDITSAVACDADGLAPPLGRVARAWALADRHGVALAELLDSVRRDVEHRVSFARDTEAKMAGPRATAFVLAVLPVLGLLLGEAAGAAPVAVLIGEPFGQILMVVGVGLLCVGLLWTVRLTEAVVRV